MIDVLHDNDASVGDLRAEIERLQEHKRQQAEDIITLGQMVGKLEVKIERVRAALEEAKHLFGNTRLWRHVETRLALRPTQEK